MKLETHATRRDATRADRPIETCAAVDDDAAQYAASRRDIICDRPTNYEHSDMRRRPGGQRRIDRAVEHQGHNRKRTL